MAKNKNEGEIRRRKTRRYEKGQRGLPCGSLRCQALRPRSGLWTGLRQSNFLLQFGQVMEK